MMVKVPVGEPENLGVALPAAMTPLLTVGPVTLP
jgi:hypothetical protein